MVDKAKCCRSERHPIFLKRHCAFTEGLSAGCSQPKLRFLCGIHHHGLTGDARLSESLHKPWHPGCSVNRAGPGVDATQALRMVKCVVLCGTGFQHLVGQAKYTHQRSVGLLQPGLVQRWGQCGGIQREQWPCAVLPDVVWGGRHEAHFG